MVFFSQRIVANIKKEEIDDGQVLDQFTVGDFVGDIKHEPERHFVFIMPDDPEIEEVKKVKIVLWKFDRKWKTKSEMFKTYFACDKCKYVCRQLKRLNKHTEVCKTLQKCEKCFLIGKSENVEECGLCDLKFDCKNCKLDHISRDHHKDLNWQCIKCDFKTLSKRSLKEHFPIHVKQFSCETCEQKFSRKYKLKNHQMNRRHGVFATEPEIKFECKKCIHSYATQQGLRQHENQTHKKRKLHCDLCEKIFKSKGNLRRHMQTHIKVPCPICKYVIAEYRLKEHIGEHSITSKFKCDECEKVYVSQNKLNIHKNAIHVINEVQCDLCSKVFKNKILLRSHMGGHLKIPCPICKMSISKNVWKRHKDNFHSSGQKFLRCNITKCREKIVTIKELKEHAKTHIGTGIYKCPICNLQTKNITSVKRHMKRKHKTPN